jgi:hypothetical protein
LPASVVAAVTDPVGEFRRTIEDYKRRYGGSDAEQIARLKEEGAFAELADATIFIGGGGAAVGRGLGAAARRGKLGSRAERTAAAPRRRQRVSGGAGREQDVSPNLFVAAVQKARDERLYRNQQRRVDRADRDAPAGRKGAVDATLREATSAGEVIRSSKLAPTRPSVARTQRIARRDEVARPKGRAVHALKQTVRREIGLGANRTWASLNRAERGVLKTASQAGAVTPAAGRAWVLGRIALIERSRGGKTPDVGADELGFLREVAANPERYFTENTARGMRVERDRAKRAAEQDPSLGATVSERRVNAEVRARRPQAEVLGVVREGTPVREAQAAARKDVLAARRTLKAARKRARRQAERAAVAEGRAKILVGQSEARARRKGSDAAAASTRPRSTLRALERERGKSVQADAAVKRAEERVKAAEKAHGERVSARKRGQELWDAEPAERFLGRAREAAAKAGLEEPGFFPSQKRETVRRSAFAAGGSRAVKADRRYSGQLFREGREDASATTYVQGVTQNFKRAVNWNLVADTFDANAYQWGRNKTIGDLLDELERRGIDPDSVAFWNPDRYRDHAGSRDRDGTGRFDDESGDLGQHDLALAIADSTVRGADASLFRGTGGRFSVVPKAVMDELDDAARPSGVGGRAWEVSKGKQARILLATSPAWLQFQVASNLLLTAIAGVGPGEVIRAHKWWKGLDDAQRRAVESHVGVGAFDDALAQTKLGSSTNARIVNAWRAFKAHPFWHNPRKGLRGRPVADFNPLDVLFRIDQAQNNAFRKAVLYNRVKRDAYRRMGGRVKAMQAEQSRLSKILGMGPEAQMKALLDDPKVIERHARAVNDMLGDYMTFTTRERRVLNRSIMFYGFLRFSLRYVFYTMPVKHPVVTAILAQMGRMQTEEVRRLLGGDELPWALGRFYFTTDGQLKSVDLARANPALNTLTDVRVKLTDPLGSVKQLLSFGPPLFVALLDQAYAKTSYKGRPFRVEGETVGRKDDEYGNENRWRIFAAQMLRLIAPYRSVERATARGPEGDDTLIFDRRPTRYKDPATLASLAADERRRPQNVAERIAREFLPLIPRDDYGPEQAAAIRKRDGKADGGAVVVDENKLSPGQRALLNYARKQQQTGGGASVGAAALLRHAQQQQQRP